MVILNATTKSLEVKLAGAAATNQLPVVASYVDVTTTAYTPGANDTQSNGATAVTVVAAPAASTQRQVKLLTVYNADTAAATVTVQLNNNGTLRVLAAVTLAVGSTLIYTDGEGWRVLTSAGAIVTSTLSPMTSAQLAAILSDETGYSAGALAVFSISPALTTPNLGTPSALTLTNATGLPTGGLLDAAVTLAKMANLAQDQFVGRVTASTGVPETATITAAARTVLDDTTVAAMVDTLGGAASSGTGGLARITSPVFVTQISTPAIVAPAALTITPAAGSNVDIVLASTAEFKIYKSVGNLRSRIEGGGNGAEVSLVIIGKDSDTTTRIIYAGIGIIADNLFTISNGSSNWVNLKISTGFFGLTVINPASRFDIGDGAMTISEMTAPSAPAANGVVIYAEDNGAGKTRLMALFSSGAAQQLAIQP